MASAVAQACNGGLGLAMPPVGSRGKAPSQGVRGRSPLKLSTFLHLNVKLNNKNCIMFCIIYAINMLQFMQTAGTLLIYKLNQLNCG